MQQEMVSEGREENDSKILRHRGAPEGGVERSDVNVNAPRLGLSAVRERGEMVPT